MYVKSALDSIMMKCPSCLVVVLLRLQVAIQLGLMPTVRNKPNQPCMSRCFRRNYSLHEWMIDSRKQAYSLRYRSDCKDVNTLDFFSRDSPQGESRQRARLATVCCMARGWCDTRIVLLVLQDLLLYYGTRLELLMGTLAIYSSRR